MLLVSYEINGGHLYLFYHTSTFFSATIDKCPLSGPILHHFWLLLLYPTATFQKLFEKIYFLSLFLSFSSFVLFEVFEALRKIATLFSCSRIYSKS